MALSNADTRMEEMAAHVMGVAEAILNDTSGDGLMSKYLELKEHIHNYSIRNRVLIEWQAPDSVWVASMTAYNEMARKQGHEGKKKTSKSGNEYREYVHPAKGCHAVWIWGAPRVSTYEVEVTDEETNEKRRETRTRRRFFPTTVFRAEDIRYHDTGEPFEVPSFLAPVPDADLHRGLLTFAQDNGIEVSHEGIAGSQGVSKGGAIGIRGDVGWELQVPTILHELAHELLHQSGEKNELSTKLMEGEAEAACAVVLRALGHPIGPSAAYMRSHGVKPTDVMSSMQRIMDAAGRILSSLLPEWATAGSSAPPGAAGTPDPAQGAGSFQRAA